MKINATNGISNPSLWDLGSEIPIISQHESMKHNGRKVMRLAQKILRNQGIHAPSNVVWVGGDDHAKVMTLRKRQTIEKFIYDLQPQGKIICCGDSPSDDFLKIKGVISGYFGKASEMRAHNVYVMTNERGDNVKAKGFSPFINEVLKLEYGTTP